MPLKTVAPMIAQEDRAVIINFSGKLIVLHLLKAPTVVQLNAPNVTAIPTLKL